MTKNLQKSSPIEQKLYDKYDKWQKRTTKQTKEEYLHCKSPLEATKKKYEKLYYSQLKKKNKNHSKKHGILWKR